MKPVLQKLIKRGGITLCYRSNIPIKAAESNIILEVKGLVIVAPISLKGSFETC
jgi:hypothetical protein